VKRTAIVLWVGLALCAGCGDDDDDADALASADPERDARPERHRPDSAAIRSDARVPLRDASADARADGEQSADAGEGGRPDERCTAAPFAAEPFPVDLFVILDRSASMLEPTAAGVPKWDAVREALVEYANAGGAAGVGIGLQLFPLGRPGVPEQCFTDAECTPSGGVCLVRACRPTLAASAFVACLSGLDCPAASSGCVPLGQCRDEPSLLCFDVGDEHGCGDSGACDARAGECMDYASCEPAAYARPAVAIDTLPGNASAFTDALRAAHPLGTTPLSPALSGAINYIRARAAQRFDRRAVVVLVSDGLPTVCFGDAPVTTPQQAVAHAAQRALEGRTGAPKVISYVIGIHAADGTDLMTGLDEIALAGGSQRAFAVDASGDVRSELSAALSSIHDASGACRFRMPSEIASGQLDWTHLRVQIGGASPVQLLARVADHDRCEGVAYGWFADGEDTVALCPFSCNELQQTAGGRLELRLDGSRRGVCGFNLP